MEEKILIDKDTLKAIVVDTRMNILKLLSEKKRTQTEISDDLNLSAPTVAEHLKVLESAGLISKEETDRKWKYYSLTNKGRRLVEPHEVRVLFAFIASLFAAIGFSLYMFRGFFSKASSSAKVASAPLKAEGQNILMAAAPAAQTAESTGIPVSHIIILVALLLISAFLLGYYLKKKMIIIR